MDPEHPQARALRQSLADLSFIRDAQELSFATMGAFTAASACRLALTTAFAAIDRALSLSASHPLSRAYFAKNVSNAVRLKALGDALQTAGVHIDDETLNDFLAMRYLRNAAAHSGSMRDADAKFVEARGIHPQLAVVTDSDWDRFTRTLDQVFHWISTALMLDEQLGLSASADVDDIRFSLRRVDPLRAMILPTSLPGLWWNELEKLESLVRRQRVDTEAAIEPALELWSAYAESAWPLDFEETAMLADEMRRLLLRAGMPLFPPLSIPGFMDAVGEVGLAATPFPRAIVDELADCILGLSQVPRPTLALPVWSTELPVDVAQGLMDVLLAGTGQQCDESLLKGIIWGSKAYRVCRNRSPVDLLIQLAQAVPSARRQLGQHAKNALNVFALGRYWYCWAETPRYVPGLGLVNAEPTEAESVQDTMHVVRELRERLNSLAFLSS